MTSQTVPAHFTAQLPPKEATTYWGVIRVVVQLILVRNGQSVEAGPTKWGVRAPYIDLTRPKYQKKQEASV